MPEKIDPALLARACRSLRRRDPRLGEVIRRVGACGIEATGDPYRALLRSVIYQQLAGAAATAIATRVRALFGGRYPRPARLLAAPEADLRAAGLSRQKIAALRAVAQAFDDRSLSNRRLYRMEADEVVAAVTTVKGIGEWTAHMLLMFSLGHPDILPVGDYGVRKGAMQLYDLADLPKRAELEALAEPWRPYRSIGAWYLWRHLENPPND
ncbi:MAG: DNA-3-methyladenine glycosylase 2 family protein [Deltaproteobacteria bacterium]|nr:DNA-3-methyladenine glycosylase 2 family protein [Deltaproteobacteria bacterium]